MAIDKPVVVERGTTAIRVVCNANGRFADAPSVSVHPWLKRTLTEYEWDVRRKCNVVKYQYFLYDRNTGYLHLPSQTLPYLLDYLRSCRLEHQLVETGPNPASTIDVEYQGDFEHREYQEQAIDFLTSDQTMKALSLITGGGKTFVAARTILTLKLRTLIILPAYLVDQWSTVFSSLSDAKVAVLRGSDSIQKLYTSGYQNDADIFLASINTIQKYAIRTSHYEALPELREFLREMQFGIKIVDECHLNFHANVMIDIQSDIKHNIYLSATHMRSSKNSNQIFRRIYPDEVRYDDGQVAKYVNVTQVNYSLGRVDERYVITPRGYSTFKYEKWMLKRVSKLNQFLDKVWGPVVEEYYTSLRKPGQKLLVLIGLTDFGSMLVEWFQTNYPSLYCSEYFNATGDEVLDEADIIVSTVGSCGTGKDLQNLRTMIVLPSFAADTLNLQALGRLRKLPDGDTPEFVYLINTEIVAHRRHAKTRQELFKPEARQFRVVTI